MNNIVKKIIDEKIDYKGLVNFASLGINSMPEAFIYGLKIGIEITKKDCIKLIVKDLV